MINYKNLDLLPGIPGQFQFELLDDNLVKLVLAGYTFKLEVLDNLERLVLVKTMPSSTSMGSVTFTVTDMDGAVFKTGLYSYRLVITDYYGVSTLVWKGFIAVGEPSFDLSMTPAGGTITLPDGTLYVTRATTLVPDVWYATATYFRFLVDGIGTMTIDGRSPGGVFFINLGVYQSSVLGQVRWIPDLTGMAAFRLKQTVGSNTVQYLP